jgi:serine-type D-Ala-D-Ala endopeptidase (penicillin-binding protein 7)
VQQRFRRVARVCVVALSVCLVGPAVERVAASTSLAEPTLTPVATKKRLTKPKKSRRYSASAARSRRARLARAKAAARARQWREAAEPRFKLDETGALVPDVRAAAAIIYNPETNEVLWESNSQDSRSIASITKVMTALVLLEGTPDLTREVEIERESWELDSQSTSLVSGL